MKYIKLFESVDNMVGNFYILFGSLIYVKSVDIYGGDWRIVILKEKGEEEVYIGDRSDIDSDFKPTNTQFNINVSKKPIVYKKPKIDNIRYNIVFYMGNKKMETIRTNLERKLAYGLRGTFLKDPKYKGGRIEVESIS